MTFDRFCCIVQDGVEKGVLRVDDPSVLTESSLAIQFAIGKEMERRGAPITLTYAEIAKLVEKHCGPDVYARFCAEAETVP